MKQKVDAKYNDVLNTLAAEMRKPATRIQRLLTVAPNQGVIRRFFEIFEEKYPETDIGACLPNSMRYRDEMSLINPNTDSIVDTLIARGEMFNVTVDSHPPHCPDCGSEMSLIDTDETITIEYFGPVSDAEHMP